MQREVGILEVGGVAAEEVIGWSWESFDFDFSDFFYLSDFAHFFGMTGFVRRG